MYNCLLLSVYSLYFLLDVKSSQFLSPLVDLHSLVVGLPYSDAHGDSLPSLAERVSLVLDCGFCSCYVLLIFCFCFEETPDTIFTSWQFNVDLGSELHCYVDCMF